MSVNTVCVSGNLTRDPDLRTTKTGMPVLEIGIAVNERVKENGDWKDRPSFFDAIMFGSRAQNIAQYLSKGTKVTISGKLRQQRWERDGHSRSKVEIIVDDIDFANGRSNQGSHGSPEPSYSTADSGQSYYDEEIPF